jgi:hypothetical protein
MLTVDPQSTIATTPTKTPEQMQQEAQQGGWWPVFENDFYWRYPFYQLKVKLTSFQPEVDIVVTPLALDIAIQICDETEFARAVEDNFGIGYDIALGQLIAHGAAAAAAHFFGKSSWTSVVAAVLLNTAAQMLIAVAANYMWKDARTWYIAYMGALISIGAESLLKLFNGRLFKFFSTICQKRIGTITHEFNFFWAKSLRFGPIGFCAVLVFSP